jgi:hypothetical protein
VLSKYGIMKTDEIVEVLLNTFSSLVLDGGELSLSCPSHCTSWEINAITHWIASLVDHRAGQEAVEKRKISAHADSTDIQSVP